MGTGNRLINFNRNPLRGRVLVYKHTAKLSHSRNFMTLSIKLMIPGGSAVKNPPANAGDAGWIPGLGRFLGEGNGNPPQYSCLENPHGQRSLAGYSLSGRQELDTTEAT